MRELRIEKVASIPNVYTPSTLYLKQIPDSQYLDIYLSSNDSLSLKHIYSAIDSDNQIINSLTNEAHISGPSEVVINETIQFQITNYSVDVNYSVIAVLGTVNRVHDIIYFTAPAEVNLGTFVINGRVIHVTVLPPITNKPSIISPANNSTNLISTVDFVGSAFATTGGTTFHVSSDWELSTSSDFSTITHYTYDDTIALTSWRLYNLLPHTTYYARVRYKSYLFGYSNWSDYITVTTIQSFTPADEEAKLVAFDKQTAATFSHSVSISGYGEKIIIGTPFDSNNGSIENGAAYVYIRTNNAWTLQAKITAEDHHDFMHFGFSVSMSIDGNRVIVGAPRSTVSGITNAGASYIYRADADDWVYESKLSSPSAESNDFLGTSVSISSIGDKAVIGSSGSDYDGVIDAGSVYIFKRIGVIWNFQQRLKLNLNSTSLDFQNGDLMQFQNGEPFNLGSASNVAASMFGNSVDINGSGTRLVIGSYLYPTLGVVDTGFVYIFDLVGNVWTFVTELKCSDTLITNVGFSYSVNMSFNGDIVAVGISNLNAVYIFKKINNVWTQTAKLTPSDTTNNTYSFGSSVSITSDGNRVVIGSYSDGGKGSAYVFTYLNNVWVQDNKLIPLDIQTNDLFGGSVAVTADGTRAVISSEGNDPGNLTDAGAAYVYK